MDKLVSVIVPVYGTEAYLDRCVSSLINQTYHNLEIILVDDGGLDRCPQMCDRWAASDLRIKVIHKSNGGLSSARNAGIDSANGDYLYFLDSDDWIALVLIEKIMKIFEAYGPDIVTFDCNRINENDVIYATTENIKEGMISREEAIAELLKGNINNYASNKVYKKQVFSNVRFPEGRVWEDMAVAYKLFLNSKRIYCFPEALLFYYTRTDSISRNINEKALACIFLARYECHLAMTEQIPSLQKLSLPLAALSARRLYDRSLWRDVDIDILEVAKSFLEQNRDVILSTCKDSKYHVFYKFPKIYVLSRIILHKFGKLLKGKS